MRGSQPFDKLEVDVPAMLETLGIRNVSVYGDECEFSCPFTGHAFGDSSPSAYMNVETTLWMCHGCKRKGDAAIFLAELESVPVYTARRWLREKYSTNSNILPDGWGAKMLESLRGSDEESESVREPLDEERAHRAFTRIDWSAYAASEAELPLLSYMLARGFEPSTLTNWGFVVDQRDERVVFPVRDENGGLVGFKGRAITQERAPRYRVMGDTPRSIERHGELYGFGTYDVSSVLFGADRAVVEHELIVCEGELNVVMLHQLGQKHAVGIGGSYLSDEQARIARDLAPERIVLLVDDPAPTDERPDGDGRWISEAVAKLEPFVPVRVCASHEGDPASMDPVVLLRLIAESRTLLRWKMAGTLGYSLD